jgi:hypothetical protein
MVLRHYLQHYLEMDLLVEYFLLHLVQEILNYHYHLLILQLNLNYYHYLHLHHPQT